MQWGEEAVDVSRRQAGAYCVQPDVQRRCLQGNLGETAQQQTGALGDCSSVKKAASAKMEVKGKNGLHTCYVERETKDNEGRSTCFA